MKKLVLLASILAVLLSGASTPVMAQRVNTKDLPKVNFYMARQQIQIIDDAPSLNDMRTNPAAAQQQGGAGAGASPRLGQGLPRAGFMTNMGAYHGSPAAGALPRVNNGVPKSLPHTNNGLNNGLKAASAGKLKTKSHPPAQPHGPVTAKGYKPYATTPMAQSSSGTGSSLNSSTAVKGSVLHWNRNR